MTQALAKPQPTELEAQRLELLRGYNPHDHLLRWTAYDKRTNKSQTVIYYPAAWRLYELSLRYPNANFSSDIIHMDAEKDFVIVRARLYLGNDYALSEKRAEAHKQGRLTELDRVETKAKARAARDFGIGTEHALDMDDMEGALVEHATTVTVVESNGQNAYNSPQGASLTGEAKESPPSEKSARIGTGSLPVPSGEQGKRTNGQHPYAERLNALYDKAREGKQFMPRKGTAQADFLAWIGCLFPDRQVTTPQDISLEMIEYLEVQVAEEAAHA